MTEEIVNKNDNDRDQYTQKKPQINAPRIRKNEKKLKKLTSQIMP